MPMKQRGTISTKKKRPKTQRVTFFLEGGEDLDSVVSVGREEVSVDCELVPIMREESSITDSVSPIS
jgi:hypothetical protein